MEIVGIDWGRKKHYCYLLHQGKKLVLKNKEEDFAKLLKIKEAVYVIEDGNNRIVDYLLRNNRQVYILPSRRSSEARSFFVIEGKSDFIDSKVIAMTYEHNPEWCLQVKREGIAFELDVLVEENAVINVSMMQDIGRLDAYLERYWPEVKEVFSGTSARKLAFISICPTAKDFLSMSDKEILQKLKEMGFLINSNLKSKLKELRKIALERYVPASIRTLIVAFSRYAMEKKVMKEEIGKQMKEIIEESEFSVLLTLPGVGVIIASQLIVAYLTHKFSSYRDLQRYAGTTPTYYGSGNKNATKMRSNCNHYLRGTLHIASLAATNSSKWMKRFYDNKKSEGKSSAHALRALANTILKIAFAMLRDLTPYSEEKFLKRNPLSDYTPSKKEGKQKPECSLKVSSVATCRSTA
jgi:hypothetical protein